MRTLESRIYCVDGAPRARRLAPPRSCPFTPWQRWRKAAQVLSLRAHLLPRTARRPSHARHEQASAPGGDCRRRRAGGSSASWRGNGARAAKHERATAEGSRRSLGKLGENFGGEPAARTLSDAGQKHRGAPPWRVTNVIHAQGTNRFATTFLSLFVPWFRIFLS